MSAGRITMIIPNQSGGVMDYVDALVERMPDARVLRFQRGMDADLDGDRVLLHLSGYGYARYGAPLHLLGWLRRNRPRMQRFGVFVHEAYAVPTRITSSVFWVWRAQRYVASQMVKRADFWVTNTELKFDWLRTQAGSLPHRLMPICSSVGELAELPAVRNRTLVVFGSDAVRTNTWRAASDSLFRWARAAGLELHDIGAPVRDAAILAALQAHGVVQHGRLASGRIHALLGEASYGALAYSPHDVAKSSIFAAYCAHGMVPVLLPGTAGSYDGLVSGTHYLQGVPVADPLPADVAGMARAAFDWYQGHSVAACAEAIDDLLRPAGA